jgi:hypothetical protein
MINFILGVVFTVIVFVLFFVISSYIRYRRILKGDPEYQKWLREWQDK